MLVSALLCAVLCCGVVCCRSMVSAWHQGPPVLWAGQGLHMVRLQHQVTTLRFSPPTQPYRHMCFAVHKT